MAGERGAKRWPPEKEEDSGPSPAAIFLFALVGATATAAAAAVGLLHRSVRWFYTQLKPRRPNPYGEAWERYYQMMRELNRSEPYVYWEDVPRRPNRYGEAWERYYQMMRDRSEDQSERVEHIRRMQDVFKKERSKCRDYRMWESHNPNYYQHSRRDDGYWDAEPFYANQRTNFRSMPRETMSYAMSRHYSILGLDRSRPEPFSDSEIKNAFRRKAMEYHPDQNQNNKEVAEAKFKEVMDSYEAIKSERRNGNC